MTPLDWLVLALLTFGGALVLVGWCWLIVEISDITGLLNKEDK